MLNSIKVKNNKLTNNKIYWMLLISCWLVYIAMMIGKSIYNAEIIEVMNTFKVNKTIAGYATTAYYFTYGFMQLVIAKILPKINLKLYLGVTISLSAVCTAFVGLIAKIYPTEIWPIWILLGLNGIFHAAIWPSCVFIASKFLPAKMQSTANMLYSTGFAIGFIMSYVFSALFIRVADWTVTFLVFGLATFIPLIIFIVYFSKAQRLTEDKADIKNEASAKTSVHHNHKLIKKYLRIFYLLICVVSFLVNIVYYGMNNWVPSLMREVFDMPSSLSTFLTVLVPVVGLIGPIFTIFLTNKYNLWYVSSAITLVAATFIMALAFGYKFHIVSSLSLSVIVLTLMRGSINSVGTTLALKVRILFNAGSFSAITNALASLGASAAPPITGSIIDNLGWSAYYICMVAISVLAVILIFVLNNLTKKLRLLKKSVLS